MEIRNVIELSAFSKSLSKKITYLNHEEHILIDIEQIAAITPTSEREDLPKKVGLASCNNDEAKEELYTCVLLKCGFSIRVIESVEEVYNKIHGTVGRRLTDEEFVNMYPSQCNIFKEIFKEEFQVAYQKVYEKLKNKK